MKFSLPLSHLNTLKGYVAEHIAYQALKMWLRQRHPEIRRAYENEKYRIAEGIEFMDPFDAGCRTLRFYNPISDTFRAYPHVKVYFPSAPSSTIGAKLRTISWARKVKGIDRKLPSFPPDLKPLEKIYKRGGASPDLLVYAFLAEGKVGKYFVEAKSGKAGLSKKERLTQRIVAREGFVPLAIYVKRIDLERNSFDVMIEEGPAKRHKLGCGGDPQPKARNKGRMKSFFVSSSVSTPSPVRGLLRTSPLCQQNEDRGSGARLAKAGATKE